MMFITKPFLRGASGVLLPLLLLLSSCEKPLPVPKNVIDKACENYGIDYVIGEPSPSDGKFGVTGKAVYPVRVTLSLPRALPIKWDKLTGLPRLPPETEMARAVQEFEFTQNEWGEWLSRDRDGTFEWIDPEKGSDPNFPENGRPLWIEYIKKAEQMDIKLLERLLAESRQADEENGGEKSYETIVRENWVKEVTQMQQPKKQMVGFPPVATWTTPGSATVQGDVPDNKKLLAPASQKKPFTNSLGMQFVPVDIGKKETTPSRVLFSIWETRSRDFAAFVKATSFDAGTEWMETEFQEIPVGRGINERLEESNHPVVFMCKEYGEAFCKWLTEKERASGVIGPDDEYRLPTDAEWSYAVGIGEQENDTESPSDKEGKLKGVFPWDGAYPPPEGSGNFADTTSAEFYDWEHLEGYRDGHITTAPVGSFKPNQLGLYDMAGNVFEATSSVYDSEGGVPHHVLRGSCWLHHREESLNSSSRISDARGDRRGVYGFRCVLARSNTAGQSKP